MDNILKNTFFIGAEKFFKFFIFFFTNLVIAQIAGPKIYGSYSAILAVCIIFTTLSSLGLNNYLSKLVLRTSNKKKLFRNIVYIRFLSFISFSTVCFLFLYFFMDIRLLFSIIAAGFIFITLAQVNDVFFESQLRAKIIFFYKAPAYLMGLGLKVIALYSDNVLLNLLLANLTEYCLFYLFSLIAINNTDVTDTNKSGNRVDFRYVKVIILKALPLALSSAAVVLYTKIDNIFILKFLDEESVGFYAAAARFSEIFFLIPTLFLPSIFPMFLKEYRINRKHFNKKINLLLYALIILGAFFSTFIILFAEKIVILVYGDQYLNSVMPLKIISLIIPLVYIDELLRRWIIITDNLAYAIQRQTIGLFVNIILNFILIPIYGLLGAAVASLISFAFSTVVFSLYHVDTRKIFYEKPN